MSAALAAAHIGHQIEHSSAMFGFIVGALAGLAVGALLVAATVATGGAALVVVAAVGGAIASTGGGALLGMALGQTNMSPKGPITTGSPNVFYGPARIPAARAIIDQVACKDHGLKRLATGSDSVFLNEYPAVRDDDKSECDGTVKSEITHIFIGAETAQYLEIQSEVPEFMVNIAQGMVIVGSIIAFAAGAAIAVSASLAAGTMCAIYSFAAETALGILGGAVLAPLGGAIGEAIGGERGRIIGEAVGGFVGGFAGGGLGRRLPTGHPVDVATGELYTSDVDFTITGLIEIPWERFWISSSDHDGALGHKWHHPLDMEMAEAGAYYILRVEHGRLIVLPKLAVGQSFYHRAERLLISRDAHDRWHVRKNNQLTYHLVPDPHRSCLRLAAITDANSNHIELQYDARGALARVTGTDGIVYLFTSDDALRITAVKMSNGTSNIQLARYRYDAAGNMAAAIDPANAAFRFEYRNHLMTREIKRGGLSYYFEWDDLSLGTHARCIKTWGDGDIYWRAISYSPAERKTRVRDLKGAEETFFYNDNGLVTKIIMPLGQVSTLKYNRFAEPEAITDPIGATTLWRQDQFGRVSTLTDRGGARAQLRYVSDDPTSPNFSNVSLRIDALGAEASFEYDARGNLVTARDALGNTTRILRDPRGLPLNLQDAVGTVARFSWSAQGRLREERSAKGGTSSREYDGFGRLISKKLEGIEATTYGYDDSGRVVRINRPGGSETVIGYDPDDNIVSLRQPTGAMYHWDFGGLTAPLTRINPDGSRFNYHYDAEMKLTDLQNEVGDCYRLEYDLNQRLISETAFDGRRQEYDYDAAGNITAITDGHRQHLFQRDPMGRLLRRDSSDGDWASFSYDVLGRMSRADNAIRQIAYDYDVLGNVIAERQDQFELSHGYSARGQRTATILPDGRYLRFGYDQNGDFDTLRVGERDVLSVDRDRIGREVQRVAGTITETTHYDPQGRIERKTAYRRSASSPLFGRSYAYDVMGRITSTQDITRGATAFGYDARDRLRSALSENDEEIFGFDPASVILADVKNPSDASVQRGRLVMRGDAHYEYDDAGNRISMRRARGGLHRFSYAYDDMNRLKEVHEVRGQTQRDTEFTYDALGRRVSKVHRERITAANSAKDEAAEIVRDDTTWFLWNGDILLAEARGDASGAADPLAIVYVYEPESFRPAAQIRRTSPDQDGRVLLYWSDHLGTPQQLSNENGEIVWQVALKAWGGVARTYINRVSQNLRFQGQYHDEETGLHYNRFRHYDPASGIFLNPDPIALLGGERPFAYPLDPLAGTDPLGLYEPGHTNDGRGYIVYQLVDQNTGKVVYVGITESQRYDQRMSEHIDSKRLHEGLRQEQITKTKTLGQARGAEQYHILNSNDGAGTLQLDQRGQPIGPGTEGNRARSYAEGREDSRARYYQNAYRNERDRVNALGNGCKG